MSAWWHSFGLIAPDGPLKGLVVQVFIGPTSVAPDDPKLKEGVPAPLPDSMPTIHLPYLASWDHEPTGEEKEASEPEPPDVPEVPPC